MANKRLSFNVDEKLHNRLKAEASAAGVTLGAYCTAILEGGLRPTLPTIDTITVRSIPLDKLRQMANDLAVRQPDGWKDDVTKVNSEIMRRYRV